MDDDGHEQLLGRGCRRQRPEARRTTVVPHETHLVDGFARDLSIVHVQPRTTQAGASATVVAVTEALSVGTVVNIVRVGSEEIESNYRNNVAAAVARVVGRTRVLGAIAGCRTLTAAPPALEARRTSTVRLEARNRLGKAVAGLVVRAAGAGVRLRARTDRQGVARMEMTPSRVGLVHFASGGRRTLASSGVPTCFTALGAQRARPTKVTG